jgi:hypothetical protein
MFRAVVIAILATFMAAGAAFGQSALLQGGPFTPGRAPMYVGQGFSQPIVQDSGPAAGGGPGVGLSELGLTVRGTGTPPYANAGSGFGGSNFCDYDAPTTNSTGYHFFCISPNAQGGGFMAYGAAGGATAEPFQFSINGVIYQFPFSTTGVVGPSSSTIGHVACWNNTAGTLLADCGVLGPLATLSPIGTGVATALQDNVNSAGGMLALTNQNANLVLAGPSSGGAATPTFRALVPLDIPAGIPGSSVNYTQSGTGGATMTMQQAIAQYAVTPQQFGATCDGSTDDHVHLQNWLNALGTVSPVGANNVAGYLPAGSCATTVGLTLPTKNGITIFGNGLASEIIYTGASTTTTLLTGGTTNGGCSIASTSITNILLASSTAMTAGSAMEMDDTCATRISNVGVENNAAGSLPSNWYNGITLAGGNQVYALNNTITGSNIPLVMYGDSAIHSSTQLTDPHIIGGLIIGGATGVDIGGNVGGAVFDDVDILSNKGQVKISQDFVAIANKQIFFGSHAFLDATAAGGTGRDLDIEDPGGSASLVSLQGTWLASATAECLYIASGVTTVVNMTGGWIVNCGTDGFANHSTSAVVSLNEPTIWMTAAGFAGSTGYAFNCAVSDQNVWIKNPTLISWGSSGQFSSSCNPQLYTSNGSPSQFTQVPIQNGLYPGNGWQYDVTTQTAVTVANSANAPFTAGSGAITLTIGSTGDTATYLCGGGACVLQGTSTQGAWVASSTTPASTKASVAYDGSSNYRIYNNTGGSINVAVSLVRTRGTN